MNNLNAIYVLWTRPKQNENKIILEDYEILTMAISSLTYRNLNKSQTTLYTDKNGYDLLSKQGLLFCWTSINTVYLEEFSKRVSPDVEKLYSAGKAYILSLIQPPYIYIDNDAIIYENININRNFDIAYAHFEIQTKDKHSYYLNKDEFILPTSYSFNKAFNFGLKQWPNTSVLVLNSAAFQQIYKDELERFFKYFKLQSLEQKLAFTLLIDQRFFHLIADSNKFKEFSLLPGSWNIDEYNYTTSNETKFKLKNYIHLWDQKKIISKSKTLKLIFMKDLFLRMKGFITTNDLHLFKESDFYKKQLTKILD